MSKENLALISLSSLVVFHFIANFSGWYLSFPGLDKISHFWGGLALAAIFLWQFDKRRWRVSWWKIIGLVLIGAVAWEIHEFILDQYIEVEVLKTQSGPMDTVWDIIFGVAGGAFIFLLERGYRRRSN